MRVARDWGSACIAHKQTKQTFDFFHVGICEEHIRRATFFSPLDFTRVFTVIPGGIRRMLQDFAYQPPWLLRWKLRPP